VQDLCRLQLPVDVLELGLAVVDGALDPPVAPTEARESTGFWIPRFIRACCSCSPFRSAWLSSFAQGAWSTPRPSKALRLDLRLGFDDQQPALARSPARWSRSRLRIAPARRRLLASVTDPFPQ